MTENITSTDVADYAKLADMTLAERIEYPFAIGVRMPSDPHTAVTRYRDMATAAMFADLATGGDNIVTRWVAVCEPEYLRTAVVWGWRQVTYFNL